jgi:hypothetical protein
VRRRILARLRPVRMAALYLRTGEVRILPDPFGSDLRHSMNEGKLRAWSVGERGMDNGDPEILIEVRR